MPDLPPRGEIRRAIRRLPRERRRALGRAIRAGRAVDDPRDAALAVAFARRLQEFRSPQWLFPTRRPTGKRRWFWLVHVAWIVVGLAIAFASVWPSLTTTWRWLIVAFAVYFLTVFPLALAMVLRTYWNAPEAERQNRALLDANVTA